MARPIKDGCSYFPHDCDLSHDEKIESLEAVHGNDGYATYLKMLERIYRHGVFVSVIEAETRQILARKCNVTTEKFMEMIEMMVRLGLFCKENYAKGLLTSNGIQKRLDAINSKRRRDRISHQVSDTVIATKTSQECLKVKERKEKETYRASPEAILVIDYLNKKAGKKFTYSKYSTENIQARISEGHTVAQCHQIIDTKVAQWKDDEKMSKFINPETLFRPSHFEKYLNENYKPVNSLPRI